MKVLIVQSRDDVTMIKFILRVENAVILISSIYWYSFCQFNWLVFAGLLLAPDIFMIGYFVDKTLGAHIYNIGHTYVLPVILLVYGLYSSQQTFMMIATIWIAHISLDRTLGFGLKYRSDFKDNHMQNV